jgi:N-acetylglucosamine-6-phosphate deacetylase
MADTHTIEGHLLTSAGFVRGRLQVHGGRIVALKGEPVGEDQARASTTLPLVLPGFVDLHLHGGGGADTMDAGNAIATIARLHARHGTTSMLATTMTAPLGDIEAALRALAPTIATRPKGTARVLGVHLEGPYIHPQRLGAQPAFTRPPSLQEILALHALAPIRVITLAPDTDGALTMIPARHWRRTSSKRASERDARRT